MDKLLDLAQQRLSTIAVGTSICIFISMLLSPVWAGDDLHRLITNNLEKLADSLEGCISEYLNIADHDAKDDKASDKKLQGYKCVLNTKASEESMVRIYIIRVSVCIYEINLHLSIFYAGLETRLILRYGSPDTDGLILGIHGNSI